MTSLTFTECCQRLSVTPKTLRQWLAQAEMSLYPHPTDARITCLTSEQLQLVATLHGRVLHPSLADDGLEPGEASTDFRAQVAQFKAQVATLQTQLTNLTLQLLREREQRTEERLLALEAERAMVVEASAPNPVLSVVSQPVLPSFVGHATEKRKRPIPLIEYGARGRYILISPEDGELPIIPDSPEWFSWLASLASFRFVGQSGRFSARRGYNQRPNRGWYAQRTIHQQFHSKYIGVSFSLTLARLELIAADLQSYMNMR